MLLLCYAPTLVQCVNETNSAISGFAVVKKGKDKQTGAPVAIKVPSILHLSGHRLSIFSCLFQVVDKSRYATGDNSLEREIQVLIKVIKV